MASLMYFRSSALGLPASPFFFHVLGYPYGRLTAAWSAVPNALTPATPAASRPPAEILERKQRAHRRDKNPRKLRRALGFLWEQIFKP